MAGGVRTVWSYAARVVKLEDGAVVGVAVR